MIADALLSFSFNPHTTHNAGSASSLSKIIQDIVQTHHRYMVQEMQQLKKVLFNLADADHPQHHLCIQLAKLFDRFARDFTRHMDTEERFLFPFLLAKENGQGGLLRVRVDEQMLENLASEDRTVGSEFGRICALARVLSENGKHVAYTAVLRKIEELENNLALHTEKERQHIEPVLRKYLPQL